MPDAGFHRAASPPALSSREREVLLLLANGATVREVADQLSLSEHTIDSHIWNMRQKYDLPSQRHLIIYAWRSGLMGCTCETKDGAERHG